jgi:hypothetical protein
LSDINPPVISNGQPAGILPPGTTSTTLSVNTDESATCKYTTSPDVPYSSMPDTFSSTDGTIHTTTVLNLQNGQTYTRYIKCRDQVGNSNTSDYPILFSVDQTLSDGLVGYWSFDDGTGTAAQDLSGNNNTGTIINEPEWVTGRVGNAISFDGIDDYVEINDSDDLDLTGGNFTLSAWIYPESFGEALNGRIIDHGGESGGNGGWSFLINNEYGEQGYSLYTKNGAIFNAARSDNNSAFLNQWQHVAVTLEMGTATFYVNGQAKGQTSGVPTPTDRNAPIRIGMSATNLSRAFECHEPFESLYRSH